MARRDKGSGSVSQRANGKWEARLELPPDPLTGKRRRATRWAETKTGAQRKLGEMRRELDKAGNVGTSALTVSKYFDQWLDHRKTRIKPSTWNGYRSKIDQHVKPVIGRKRLDKLTPADVERVEAHFHAAGLASSSALQTFRIMNRAFKDAERRGLMTRNPCSVADAPEAAKGRREPMPIEHIAKFMQANQDDPYVARFLLALVTSGRQGEILGLELDRLHLDEGWVALTRSLQRITYEHGCGGVCGRRFGGDCPHRRINVPAKYRAEQVEGGLWLLEPKSVTSKRPMALGPFIVKMLRAYIEQARPERFVFEQDGRPIDQRYDWERWKQMLEVAGLPDYPLHSLRHSTGVLLSQAGLGDAERMAIMGHSSIEMTEHYTRRDADQFRAAASALEGLVMQAFPQLEA